MQQSRSGFAALVTAIVVIVLLAMGGYLVYRQMQPSRAELTPRQVLARFAHNVRAGDLSEAYSYVRASRNGNDASGLAEVVEEYSLTDHEGVTVRAATTSTSSAVLRGTVARAEGRPARFVATFRETEGQWMIHRFVVLGAGALQNFNIMARDTAQRLARSTARELVNALESGSYQALYERFGPALTENVSPEEFRRAYENLTDSERRTVIATVRDHTGVVTKGPRRDQRGHVRFRYSYRAAPSPISIEFAFQRDGDSWKPVQADLGRASTTLPTDAPEGR